MKKKYREPVKGLTGDKPNKNKHGRQNQHTTQFADTVTPGVTLVDGKDYSGGYPERFGLHINSGGRKGSITGGKSK